MSPKRLDATWTALPEPCRILIVDDSEIDRKVLSRALRKALAGSVEIESANSFQQAKGTISTGLFHLVLVDEGLGTHSGLELVRWIEEAGLGGVSILVTGNDSPEMEEEALAAGAWHFISKTEVSPPVLRRGLMFAWSHAAQEKALHASHRELAEKEAYVVETLDAANAGILTLDGHGQIMLANKTAHDLLAIVPECLPMAWPRGYNLFNLPSFEPLDPEAYPLKRMAAGDPPAGETFLVTKPDGKSSHYYRFSGKQVVSSDRDISGVLVIQDVTRDEQMRERAERAGKLEALGQMTGGIAHDFNNLLATILASAEVAQLLPEQRSESIGAIVRAAKRGAELTKKLLSFTRNANNQATEIPLQAFLRQTRELAVRTISAGAQSPLTIELKPPPSDLAAFCDQPELEHALLNLILNSRDALRGPGRTGIISLSARSFGGQSLGLSLQPQPAESAVCTSFVEITVSDNGPGMPEHIRRKAIDPFFTTKPPNAGSGLGLTQVSAFLDKSGGSLRIYSEEGTGTTVRLLLPAAGIAQAIPDGAGSGGELQRGSGERILLVEDEDELRAMTSALLTAMGYEPIACASATEALAHLESHSGFDAVLTDIIMPNGLDGRELVHEIETRGYSIPIAFMSGYAGSNLNTLDKLFIQKPCSFAELAALMAKLIRH